MEPPPPKRFSSFTYLNITQFLGVLNDNMYKLLLVFLFIQLEGIQHSHEILSLSGIIFVMPFLLFSASSGTLADRFSKRNIIIMTKILELAVTISGVIAFYTHSKIGSFAVLGLLATQSALFGPSKYGIIPEIVPEDKISNANGLLTSFTFLAIIIGTFLASFILDITHRNYIIAASICVIFSVVGLIASFGISYTSPSGSSKKFSVLFWYEIYKTMQVAHHQRSLLLSILGSAFFLFLAAFVQLNIIPFAVESLNLSEVQGGYLFLLTALGIGTGAMTAGRISGKSIELGLVPLAAAGITICLYLLDTFATNIFVVIPLIILLGFLGGMYQVPIDSYIQMASPHQLRGQIIAATNFICFVGVLIASVLIYLFTQTFHLTAAEGFAVMGTVTFCITVVYSIEFSHYIVRFLKRIHKLYRT